MSLYYSVMQLLVLKKYTTQLLKALNASQIPHQLQATFCINISLYNHDLHHFNVTYNHTT